MATRCLDAIFASPCVRNVFTTCLKADEDGNDGGYYGPSPSSALLQSVQPYSGIERLELYGCAIGPAGMAGLVHRMPFLKILRIMHDMKSDYGLRSSAAGSEWDLSGVLEAVATASPVVPVAVDEQNESQQQQRRLALGNSITDLSIGLPTEFYPAHTAIWSLHSFTALKRLEIGAWAFLGPDPASGERLGFNKPSPPRPGFDEWDRDKDGHIPKLLDVLPPSIEEVYMYLDGDSDVWRRLFEGFGVGRAKKLPLLKRFVVWGELVCYEFGGEAEDAYRKQEAASIDEIRSHGIEYLDADESPYQLFWLTDFENMIIEDPLSH